MNQLKFFSEIESKSKEEINETKNRLRDIFEWAKEILDENDPLRFYSQYGRKGYEMAIIEVGHIPTIPISKQTQKENNPYLQPPGKWK